MVDVSGPSPSNRLQTPPLASVERKQNEGASHAFKASTGSTDPRVSAQEGKMALALVEGFPHSAVASPEDLPGQDKTAEFAKEAGLLSDRKDHQTDVAAAKEQLEEFRSDRAASKEQVGENTADEAVADQDKIHTDIAESLQDQFRGIPTEEGGHINPDSLH
ncbi:MAG: hypothetical protein KDK78_04290 [Chlamydiia bacterium]|nr:hypothetical protein [Chlamydiia bacterium]